MTKVHLLRPECKGVVINHKRTDSSVVRERCFCEMDDVSTTDTWKWAWCRQRQLATLGSSRLLLLFIIISAAECHIFYRKFLSQICIKFANSIVL